MITSGISSVTKEIYATISVILTFCAFGPYISSILRGATKPHVFSWIIWGASTFVVYLAQLSDGGGVGAWPIGLSGIISLFVALLAYFMKSDSSITRADRIFFTAAMGALPLWYFTSDPLSAVITLTAVDLIGFGPTFRKAYGEPFDEQLRLFLIIALRNITSIAALEHYSLTTTLFPTAIAVACVIFTIMVAYRRRALT